MDPYLLLVIILFGLAFSDLIVGVSNDAVNFLNSSIGSNAAPRYVIMIMASLGILIGATFSGGMMEVARKGIFHPGMFYFDEIMIIFLAVMIADVILLDLFNTFGFPTSTTVSIVFELLGAAVAIAVIKMYSGSGGQISDYINSSTALGIISGILLSIVVSFTVGAFIQFITRLVFSFDCDKTLPHFGAVWGATGITSITYFIMIKGAKGSALVTPDLLSSINSNSLQIIIITFLGWLIILQLIIWFTKINILRLIVLIGTFALAMAFAGNDLVNFIGVPLAGLSSFNIFRGEIGANPNEFLMSALAGKVKIETFLLALAGIVMTVTLWLSKKARTVTETEINLSRQDAGYERFGSSGFSRNLVRGSVNFAEMLERITPIFIIKFIQTRFAKVSDKKEKSKEKSSFDLLRASVNLTVASVLISFATSLKLPLSTTYVTFMVAMGTSFADGAWGRETAVYRVAGVTSVIGGWFLTAFGAFTGSFILALFIYWGGTTAIILAIAMAAIFVLKTHSIHRKRQQEKQKNIHQGSKVLLHGDILKKSSDNILETLRAVSTSYSDVMKGFIQEKLKKVGKASIAVKSLNKQVKSLKGNVYLTINNLREDLIESGHFYVQVLDYLREMSHSLTFISKPIFDHLDNTHKGLNEQQVEEFEKLRSEVIKFFESLILIIEDQNFNELNKSIKLQESILDYIKDLNRKQLKRTKKGEIGTKSGVLCLEVLSETKNLVLHAINLAKADRDFILYNKIL
jgi:phosphate/sulfate permease/uncharacterized protein Yka (UPF0111/DUF47 family)